MGVPGLAARTMLATALALAAAVPAQAAQDACPAALYKALGPQLDAKRFAPAGQGGTVVAATCKTSPQDDNALLAALAYGSDDVKTLFVGVLDKKTLRILRSYRTDIGEDSATEIGESSLRLDTARYQLDEKTRAIGLRFNSAAHGPSCADFSAQDDLTLFVPDGVHLRPVLTLPMSQARALAGCMGHGGDDTVVAEFAELTMALEKTATHGYADLTVQAAIVKEKMSEIGAGKKRKERWTLHYDGQRYQRGKAAPWWVKDSILTLPPSD